MFGLGWRARFEPAIHPVVTTYEFNVLIGADGRRNSLHGFQHKEFRGKLAIGITCNFVNHQTREEQNFEGLIDIADRESDTSSLSLTCRDQRRGKDLQSAVLQRPSTADIHRPREHCVLQERNTLFRDDGEEAIAAGQGRHSARLSRRGAIARQRQR